LEFAKVIANVAGFLEQQRCRFAVIGAFGLHAYGLARATQDVDFAVESWIQPKLLEFVQRLGYETLHVSTGYSNHVHPDASLGRVDFVYVDSETARRLFLATGSTLELEGMRIPVPRAEHLAAMKVQAMKNDPSRRLQEMADIQFLARLPGVDREEIRGYFEKAGLAATYDDIERSL
jgi:predicted nucleotidyltransferase